MIIETNKQNDSPQINRVQSIPANLLTNTSLNLNVRSYAGYATADTNAQLFYWFFESQKFHPELSRDSTAIANTPLAIWLNGGPGASSSLGLFLENGPLRIDPGISGMLFFNEFSWNQNMHIMYWDQPFGTGYSYAKNADGTDRFVTNENELSEMFYNALLDFLTKQHPEYLNCPLYIMGESYAGKYVPNIACKIHEKNKSSSVKLALKGICVGDGWIDARLQMKIYIDYAFALGYLDIKQQNQMISMYNNFCTFLDKSDWKNAYTISNSIVDTVSAFGGGFNPYDIRTTSDIPMANVQTYMNLPVVKQSLHVPLNQPWLCADNTGPVAEHLLEDNMSSATKAVYSEFISHSDLYRILMYTGTFDTACGSLSTERILYDLPKWNSSDDKSWQALERRIWAQPGTNVKGFFKQYKNLTQFVFPGSGHQVPYYLPAISREAIYTWLANQPFPSYIAPVTK
jgi:vitellogenic carboxypeptidase-like protein